MQVSVGTPPGDVRDHIIILGKYLEIFVNGVVSQNKTHQLPTKVTWSTERSFVLECLLGAGVKALAQNAKIRWYRDARAISASNKVRDL